MDGTPRLRPLVILGATGSIGLQTVEVADRIGSPIAGIAAGGASDELLRLAASLPGVKVAVAFPTAGAESRFRSELGDRVSFGVDAVVEMAAWDDVIVVNGIVGAGGLAPTVAALEAGNRLGLANKESLVAGGEVVRAAQERGGGELIPIDSEHSALWQCLVGEDVAAVKRLVLTASGGPFRNRSRAELESVTVEEALAHPTWVMGRRITIDSSTLMNKAFEVIEAHHLFGIGYESIEVVVHPQSIVHSLVEFVDGSIKAELGDPDMRVPIQYALTFPERMSGSTTEFDLTASDLTFAAPDGVTFPCLDLGYEAGRRGGSAPAVLNAADEVAVAAFLDRKIPYLGIADVVAATLEAVPHSVPATVREVLAVDARARVEAQRLVRELGAG